MEKAEELDSPKITDALLENANEVMSITKVKKLPTKKRQQKSPKKTK